jgi:acyl carrier protein
MAVDRTADVEESLKIIISKVTRKDNIVLTPEMTFKGMGADSLDVVQIMVALEEKYDIELVDEELKAITTMGGFIDYVKKKVAEKK